MKLLTYVRERDAIYAECNECGTRDLFPVWDMYSETGHIFADVSCPVCGKSFKIVGASTR